MASETPCFDIHHPQPLLVVISGPSGVGKDAVLNELKKRDLNLHYVVTATSRPPRPGEKDGVDYFFFSREMFQSLIELGEFIEYALVYNDYKGVPKEQIRRAMASGKDVIMRVDVQGAASLRSLCKDALLIFLVPSSLEEWLDRLTGRNSETPDTMKVRVGMVQEELRRLNEFDYVVVNVQGRLKETADTIEAILTAEHHRVEPRKVTL